MSLVNDKPRQLSLPMNAPQQALKRRRLAQHLGRDVNDDAVHAVVAGRPSVQGKHGRLALARRQVTRERDRWDAVLLEMMDLVVDEGDEG